jgi:proline iminopeptidase
MTPVFRPWLVFLLALVAPASLAAPDPARYFDISDRPDAVSGGARLIAIDTPKGRFRVWTKRVGNNPRIKVLLLHGGPGITHEYLEAFDSYFPAADIEYYYYDQLGSAYSDQPDDPTLWNIARFVDEVEQVRRALGLERDNFYLYGQSWGGLLAIEYALAHPEHLKGLIVSNMVPSIPAYNRYAREVLTPAMDQTALAEIRQLESAHDYDNPRYEELLIGHYYIEHVLRMPFEQWPDPVLRAFSKLNKKVYVPMQGPSELGASGVIAKWDRTADLGRIAVPTLAIGARHDTMEPAQVERIARTVQHGRYLYCPNGSHFAIYDDQKVYMQGIVQFIHDVDAGRFPAPNR